MPIGNITQTISTIPEAGRRGVDVQSVFVNKQEDFQDHLQGTTVIELNTLKDQLNARIGEINSTATTMNGYADTASAGASTATTKASEASASATAATTKASEASASATAALNSKNQASTFATNSSNSASNSSNSETRASKWADNNYNVLVEAGKYSAKHWATVAQNVVLDKVNKVTSTDNAIVRFNGTTGDVQNSGVIIDDNGNLLLTSGTGALGYGVGAGGTVTQLMSKSTAVTLNKPSGKIMTASDALASGATIYFALNNSLLSIGDSLVVNNSGWGTYNIECRVVSDGSAYIYITNTGSTMSQTIPIYFSIIKGATA